MNNQLEWLHERLEQIKQIYEKLKGGKQDVCKQ